jgi:ribosome-associated translation inhibitor RaiA
MSISVSNQFLQIAKCSFSNFDENSVISIRFEILRRLNALSTPFYTLNVVHVDFSIETSAANRKMQSFKFGRNSVISFRIEILRRLNALSTPFNTPNVVHIDFSVETIDAYRKKQTFKFRRKLCYTVPD